MELDKAIERVEESLLPWAEAWENNPALYEALALVLEAAKRPGALSEEHRKAIESNMPTSGYTMLREALTAALNLAGPGLTRQDYVNLNHMLSPYDVWDDDDHATRAKLDAYLEGLKGQSE